MERILSVDIVGSILMILAALLGYGSKLIAENIIKYVKCDMEKCNIIIKLVAVIVALLGMLRIFRVL